MSIQGTHKALKSKGCSFFPLQTCIFSASQLFLPQTRVFFTSCIFSASWLVFFTSSFFHVSKKNVSVFQNLTDSLRTDQNNLILRNLHQKLSVKFKLSFLKFKFVGF